MTTRSDVYDSRDPVGGIVDAGCSHSCCDSCICRGVRLDGNIAGGLGLAWSLGRDKASTGRRDAHRRIAAHRDIIRMSRSCCID
jgi:hypothetical protein